MASAFLAAASVYTCVFTILISKACVRRRSDASSVWASMHHPSAMLGWWASRAQRPHLGVTGTNVGRRPKGNTDTRPNFRHLAQYTGLRLPHVHVDKHDQDEREHIVELGVMCCLSVKLSVIVRSETGWQRARSEGGTHAGGALLCPRPNIQKDQPLLHSHPGSDTYLFSNFRAGLCILIQ